jgi:hypothetical protein
LPAQQKKKKKNSWIFPMVVPWYFFGRAGEKKDRKNEKMMGEKKLSGISRQHPATNNSMKRTRRGFETHRRQLSM